MPMFYYLLQVTICSGILYAYYVLALRNKQIHQYNRFYLLAVLIFSWLVPLIRIPVFTKPPADVSPGAYRFFEVIADNNSHFEEYVANVQTTSVNRDEVLYYAYIIVSVAMIILFILALVRIWLLLKKHSAVFIDNAVLVTTRAKGTPFSFFQFIFWNNEIDISSSVGRKILAHEMVHVKEKHTIDKIISAIVLSIGWINPFFWLARRELNMVHEFIADKKSVNGDASELAAMLLKAAYPSTQFPLTNSFFHSPIKRRLAMMTKFNFTKYPHLRRLLILPLFAIVLVLFAFRKQIVHISHSNVPRIENVVLSNTANDKQTVTATNPAEPVITGVTLEKADVKLSKVYSVMLDAGHGGHDGGAQAMDGTKESDIALEFVKTILEENTNENIKLILTRATDVYQHPVMKADLTKANNADVLVSIHAATSENTNDNGIEMYIPADSLRHYKASYMLANTLANTIKANDSKVKLQIKQRQVGIWIIKTADRPAVLIETGFLSNAADLKKLKDKNYQRQLAKAILNGIAMYLESMETQR